jgi:hypothetical protein
LFKEEMARTWDIGSGTEHSRTQESSHSDTETNSLTEILREVTEKGQKVEMKIHRTDGGSVNFYQLVLNCGGDIKRYHKVRDII